ncbi:MAG: outer membrane beta-barrel protein, partial [Bacteroidota bacterium]
DKIEDRTDTEPFGKLKIPSLAVTTGMESPYHKPEDQADLIDYEGISVVADAMSGLVQELSNNEVVRNEEINWDKAGKTVASQRLNIGMRYNFGSSQQLYLEEFYNGRGIFNAEAGVYLRARLSEYLTVMPEVHLEHKGSRYNDGKTTIEALTLPLNLLLTTPDRSGYGIRTYALIGGYYSLFLDGETEGVQIDFTNDFMDHEYGITAGFGLEFMNLQYGFYYKRGLSGILRDASGGKVVHRTISLMLGWTF